MPSQRSFLFRQMVQARRFGFGTLEFEVGVESSAGVGAAAAAVAVAVVAVGLSSELGDSESWFAVAEAGAEAGASTPVGDMAARCSQKAGSKRRGGISRLQKKCRSTEHQVSFRLVTVTRNPVQRKHWVSSVVVRGKRHASILSPPSTKQVSSELSGYK